MKSLEEVPPVDTILGYLRVKATAVSVRLWIYLYALKYTNKLSGAVAGEMIAKLTLSLT